MFYSIALVQSALESHSAAAAGVAPGPDPTRVAPALHAAIVDVPHDPLAIIVYVMIVVSVGLIVWKGRSSSSEDPK